MATSALLLTMVNVSLIGCPMKNDISPCTCKMDNGSHMKSIDCRGLNSYDEVYNALNGHFAPNEKISLKITFSKLNDMPMRSFKELNMSIESLQLNHDNLGELVPASFGGLNRVAYFSLADNLLEEVPERLWKYVPNVKTLDLGRTRIKSITKSNFKDLPLLETLVIPGCSITMLERDSIPSSVQKLHIGRNLIHDLNGTLSNLTGLVWLFMNSNYLTDLEGQLPDNAQKLKMIHASNNRLKRLPSTFNTLPVLESLFLQNNHLTSLDGKLSKPRKLTRVQLENNRIETLTPDDFTEAESLVYLIISNNKIKHLNGSLIGLTNLKFLNLTSNLMEEFSFQEVSGLKSLSCIDLSFNKISVIRGPGTNVVEWDVKIRELKLDHNEIEHLNGSLSGLPELLRLNLSFNKLKKISPDDLIGLDQLRLLDVSHNYLTTLEETSKTFLPRLEELRASHNYLTILEKDFHGLPVLCNADLSYNQIIALGRELVSKTRCKLGNGVNEGTWDTLKINLQGNPIICDAALPEISSAMEINHTRIFGVSHCSPLSEQPVTTKPNGFLGYIPETTDAVPAAISAAVQEKHTLEEAAQTAIRNTQNVNPEVAPNQYQVINQEETLNNSGAQKTISTIPDNVDAVINIPKDQLQSVNGSITTLVSVIKELKTTVDKLATRIEISTLTEKPPSEKLKTLN